MTEKQKSIIEYLDEIYYKENDGRKGKLIIQVEKAKDELEGKERIANLTEEEQRILLESARLLREESTDSIGMVETLSALFLSVFSFLMSLINITVSVSQSVLDIAGNVASLLLSFLAVVWVIYTGKKVCKNANQADRFRNVILALLLLKDDEPQEKASETKFSETEADKAEVDEINQGEIGTVKVKQNESK